MCVWCDLTVTCYYMSVTEKGMCGRRSLSAHMYEYVCCGLVVEVVPSPFG